jgi:eukaryotic-like serine/threonine-protein kinase
MPYGMKVTLSVVKGPGQGRVMEFCEPRGFIVGRAHDADFQLAPDDPYVSRRHVFLEICPPSCRLRDLGTAGEGATNPPHVNGETVGERELKDGDVIELGYTQLKVSITTQVSQRMCKCPKCGQAIQLLEGEADPELCLQCTEKNELLAPPSIAKLEVVCWKCPSNVTERANSDGRAEELRDVAIYACENHVPREDAFAGRMVKEYEILKCLGEGGMGEVYQVYHRPTARLLTLKQIKDMKNDLLVKRFERETRLLKRLRHRNIVRFLGTSIDAKGAPFLVTEYVPDGDLDSHVLKAGGRLPVKSAVQIVIELLRGLEFLHAQSVIHRDIKPSNVLLRSSSRGASKSHKDPAIGNISLIPKLADFGLAKSYERAGGTRITKPGTAMGTLMFMPPEQVRDAGAVREPADLYAVGQTLYYLLTGRYSFDFPTPEDIQQYLKKNRVRWRNSPEALAAMMQLQRIRHPLQIILTEDPIAIRKREASLPLKLAGVVDKAVRKDERQRYQTAVDFRHALQTAVF